MRGDPYFGLPSYTSPPPPHAHGAARVDADLDERAAVAIAESAQLHFVRLKIVAPLPEAGSFGQLVKVLLHGQFWAGRLGLRVPTSLTAQQHRQDEKGPNEGGHRTAGLPGAA
eukprot:scaffold18133_cov137-Isochrysis_galbana.AAC.4